MRNQPKPLDRPSAMRAYALRDSLTVGRTVALTYVKRDGSVSASAGEVTFHNGAEGMDTMSVTVLDPAKGQRTINLAGILTVDGQPV
jgi:hypothetical protein